MKTRIGFVSNSSTTSFLLAIKKPRSDLHFDYLNAIEFLVTYLGYDKDALDFFYSNGSEKIVEIKEEIVELQADVDYCKVEKKDLEEFVEKAADAMPIVERFMKLLQKQKMSRVCDNDKDRKDEIRYEREYPNQPRELAHDEIRNKEDHIRWVSKQIVELTELLEKMESYDDSWIMVRFKSDYMRDVKLDDMVQWLIENGKAEIVNKETT